VFVVLLKVPRQESSQSCSFYPSVNLLRAVVSLHGRAGHLKAFYTDRKDKTKINIENVRVSSGNEPTTRRVPEPCAPQATRLPGIESLAHPKPHGCPVLKNHLPRTTLVSLQPKSCEFFGWRNTCNYPYMRADRFKHQAC